MALLAVARHCSGEGVVPRATASVSIVHEACAMLITITIIIISAFIIIIIIISSSSISSSSSSCCCSSSSGSGSGSSSSIFLIRAPAQRGESSKVRRFAEHNGGKQTPGARRKSKDHRR